MGQFPVSVYQDLACRTTVFSPQVVADRFPEPRFRPVTANCLVMQAVGMLPVADLLQSLWKWQKLLPSL